MINESKGVIGKVAQRLFGNSLPSGISNNTTGSTTISYTTGRPVITGGSGSINTQTENWTWSGIDTSQTSDYVSQTVIFKPKSSGLGFSLLWDTVCILRVNLNATPSLSTATLNLNGSDIITTPPLSGWTYDNQLLQLTLIYQKQTSSFLIRFNVYNPLDPTIVTASTVSTLAVNGQARKLCFYGGAIELYESFVYNQTIKVPKILMLSDSIGYGIGATSLVGVNGFFYQLQNATKNQLDIIAHPGARLDEGVGWASLVASSNPEMVMIALGVNSIDTESVSSFMVKYNQIISNAYASGATKVFCKSITPNNKTNYANTPSYNSAIQAVCDGVNTIFIDDYATYNDGTGHMSATYSGDGLHFNQTGHDNEFTLLRNNLRSYINI